MVKVSSQFAELRDEIQTNYFNNVPPVVVPTPTENNEEKCPFFEFDNRYLISDICSDYLSQIEANLREPNINTLKEICIHIQTPLPILFYLSLDESDVTNEKREAFKIIDQPIKSLIKEFFSQDLK